ncbi:hypothetical protein BFJ72_g3709 [Fusarium proliferatum]|uniref:Nephrocystin 3-like N-terminal domain-containing protein n=1 Tax=Gibberella intermedia TaxID=948311 RepID=A0A420TU58_GIBIN|nr:hypothetical protein BFJ72_g3709 [Fusarium proliferatum]
MESVRQGLKQSLTNGKDKQNHVAVSIKEAEVSDGESKSTTVASNQTTHDEVTTVVNGSTVTELEYERLTKATRTVKKLIAKLDDYDEVFVDEMDIRGFLEYISDERLIHMPKRGSEWDRVLSTAQFFGLQITAFASKIDTFAACAHSSASAALASCQVLLEIGHDQAEALAPTFVALYELSMLLSTVSRIRDLEYMPNDIKVAAAHILCELIHLIGCIAIHYRQKISNLRPGDSITISFDAAFGQHIENIWKAMDDLCDRVWRHRLGNKAFSISLKSVRQRLQPSSGSSVRNTLYDEVYEHLDRSEDTCNWIKGHLTTFLNSKEKALNIWGEAGVGKSVLAEWVQERLARPLDYKFYTVLSYNFPWDSPKEATSLACVKTFVFQLLELYGRLVQAFEAYSKTSNAPGLEATLWDTLHTGLHASESAGTSFILLTDGCDEMAGGSCVADLSRTRIITFSRKVDGLKDVKGFQIKEKEVHEDLRSHLKQTLSKSRHLHHITHVDREKFINDLVVKSKGRFLWAFYGGRLLLREKSREGFFATAKNLSADISEILRLAVDKLNFKQNETLKYLLSFMLITDIPFSVQEITELLSTDLHKRAMLPNAFNIPKIASEHSEFFIIRGGRLHFRNPVTQSYFRGLLSKSLLSAKEAHSQLTLRMLLYARLNLDSNQELAIEELDDSVVEVMLHQHHLMGYVMHNWVVHFRHAGFISSGGEITLPQGFRDVFPESVMFTLLERPCWGRPRVHQDTIELYELALRVRETRFGEKHVTVLQSLIALGHIHVKFSTSSDAHLCGAQYFYRAAKLGEIILSRTSVIVGACTHLFLTWTETVVITKRTEIATCREEMIRVWIEICKHKYGRTSDEVIAWYEKLAILCELGKDRTAAQIDFPHLAIKAGNARAQKLYHHHSCIQYGYKLAEYLAGIDVLHPTEAKDDKIRTAMLTTSREIMTEVLAAFRQENIDFLRLRFEDISGLIRLLGAQQNWDQLEHLLHRLWNARERTQKSGCHLLRSWISARCLSTPDMPVRTRGRLDVETLDFSRLLAALYADSGRKGDAMALHETVLREMVSCSSGSEFGEAYPERQRFISEARIHLELLKRVHHQLQGWTKPVDEFKNIHSQLNSGLGLELPAFDKWCGGAVDKTVEGGGKYVAPRE